jgi:hypothetical protein
MNSRRNSGATETDSICSNRAPVNKLSTMGKMRTITGKRCRSKFTVMASVTLAFLVFIAVLFYFMEFSSEAEENIYGGEC